MGHLCVNVSRVNVIVSAVTAPARGSWITSAWTGVVGMKKSFQKKNCKTYFVERDGHRGRVVGGEPRRPQFETKAEREKPTALFSLQQHVLLMWRRQTTIQIGFKPRLFGLWHLTVNQRTLRAHIISRHDTRRFPIDLNQKFQSWNDLY